MNKFISYRLRNFLALFAMSFGSLSGTFSILYYGLKWNYPIAILYRSSAYYNAFSFQYIAIISAVFGIVGNYWNDYCGRATGYRRWLTMTVAMLITVMITSALAGMLHVIHNMQYGFVTENYQSSLFRGMELGLQGGWIVVLLSVPLNLVGLMVGYASLDWLSKNRR